jgi:hypothetical protein
MIGKTGEAKSAIFKINLKNSHEPYGHQNHPCLRAADIISGVCADEGTQPDVREGQCIRNIRREARCFSRT